MRKVNWSEVPDTTLLPEGMYRLEIESIDEAVTATPPARLMYKAMYRVAEGAFKGSVLFDNFAIGTPEDPNAKEQATWNTSRAARRLRRLLRGAQVPIVEDVDEMVAVAVGQQFQAVVTVKKDDGKRDPRYAGLERNEIGGYYAPGERAEGPTAPAAPKASASATTVKCGQCGKELPRAEYLTHLNVEHPE